jgi:lysophospholipid acyltransferase (LPLAT)-like uncharacterized protein
MFFDYIAFKPYIFFVFQNFSIYDLYMYYYWPIRQIHRLSVFSGGFQTFSELLSQFAPDISSLWHGHIRLLARTYPALQP